MSKKRGPASGPKNTNIQNYERARCSNQIHSSKKCLTIYKLTQNITKNTGLTLHASAQTILTPQMNIQALGTKIFKPIPEGSIGIVLDKNNSILKKIKILTNIINYNYTKNIKVITKTTIKIFIIPQELN